MAGKSENEGRDFMAFLRRVRHTEIPAHPSSFKLALLTMATFANSDGSSIKAAVPTLARCCGLKVRQMQNTLRGLQALGLIVPVGNVKGGRPGAVTEYRIVLDRLGPLVLRAAPDYTPGRDIPAPQCADGCIAVPNTPAPQCIQPTTQPPMTYQGNGGVGWDCVPSGVGLTATPRDSSPLGVSAELWAAIAARPAFLKSPAALEALAAEVNRAIAAGKCPEVLTRRLRVLLEPERQHLTRLPFDPVASRTAQKATPRRAPRKSTERIDYGRDTRSPGRDYTKW